MRASEEQTHALTLTSIALDEVELADAVKRTLLINEAARILCRHYGPQHGCHCKGVDDHCHAHTLWEPEARTLVVGLDRIGALK
jgi:hypothetical protein